MTTEHRFVLDTNGIDIVNPQEFLWIDWLIGS